MNQLSMRSSGKARRESGFTLIELLVVIIIVGILMAIAIPMFISQREKANDIAAASLVRNALTAIQSAFVDAKDYTLITADELSGIDSSIEWTVVDEDLVTTSPAWISDEVTAEAHDHQIEFYPESKTVADIACISQSGNLFAIQISALDISDTGYIKVKVIDGSAQVGW